MNRIHLLSSYALRRVKVILLAGLLASSSVVAAPTVPSAFVPVTIDGSTTAFTTVAGSGQAFNVLFDGTLFHIWYRTDLNLTITDIKHATSTDGVNFTTVGGAFSFASNPFPSGTPPGIYYDAVSLVGGSYKIIHWTPNGSAGTYPNYDYNNSVSDIGAAVNNTVVTHQGPMGPAVGTLGQTGGSFGIVNSVWYGQCGPAGQDVCRSGYTDSSPPAVAGSIYPAVIAGGPFFTSIGNPTGYVNNHGDVQIGANGLDLVLTVRDNAGNRFNRQVYYANSADNGVTWTALVGLLGGAPTLTGGFSATLNFAHPELVHTPSGYLLYISAFNANDQAIIAVADGRGLGAAPAAPVPTLSIQGLLILLATLGGAAALAVRRRLSRA